MKLNRKSRTDTARNPIIIKNLAVAGFVLLIEKGRGFVSFVVGSAITVGIPWICYNLLEKYVGRGRPPAGYPTDPYENDLIYALVLALAIAVSLILGGYVGIRLNGTLENIVAEIEKHLYGEKEQIQ